MSQENVELVRGLWEPFKGVDCTAIDWGGEAIGEMSEPEMYGPPAPEQAWTGGPPEMPPLERRHG